MRIIGRKKNRGEVELKKGTRSCDLWLGFGPQMYSKMGSKCSVFIETTKEEVTLLKLNHGLIDGGMEWKGGVNYGGNCGVIKIY